MIIGLDTRNSKSTEHKVQMLEDYIQRLRKELEHTLQNLDEKNINQFAKIKTAQIEKLIVGGNVTMGPDAYISWDNVTGNKPTQYTDELALEAINSTYIDANGVWTPNVYATNISALKGKIKTAQIEDLIVGGNVAMGPDATISWGQVTDANTYSLDAWKNSGYATHILPDGIYTGTVAANKILIGGENGSISFVDLSDKPFIPSTAADVGALPDNTYIPTVPSYIKSTYIDSTTVQSPTIIGGSITGGIVQTADTSYKRIVVDTSGITSYDGSYKNGFYAKAGTYSEGALGINHNGVSVMAMNWNGQGRGVFACGGDLEIHAGIGSYRTFFTGNVDFSSATVTGLDSTYATKTWVSSGYAVKDHSHSEYADSSHSHVEYATTLWVTQRFARDDHLHPIYLTIDSFNTKMAQHITDYHS